MFTTRRLRWCLAGAVVIGTAVAAALGFGTNVASGAGQAAGAKSINCGKSATIGLEGPLSGSFNEFTGMGQLYAQEWNAAHKKPTIHIVLGDDKGNPSTASVQAQRFASNSKVLAVIGPGSSSESLAAGPVFSRADLGFSPLAATADSVVSGQFPTVVNVNPHDGLVVPDIVNWLVNTKKIKSIFIVDDGEPYNTPLADEVAPLLQAKGVKVTRAKVTQTDTDFSALVTTVPKNTDVFWMLVETAQLNTMAQQLREQGNNALIMGTDAAGASTVTFQGLDYFSFAPDIMQLPLAKNVVADYIRRYGLKAPLDAYAPYPYVAGQVVVNAVAKACANGTATRAEVVRDLRATNLKTSILGQPIKFNSKGARVGATFYLYQVGPNGTRTLIK